MPGMMPPREKTPIEKAVESTEEAIENEEEAIEDSPHGPASDAPASLNFCQSLAPLVMGWSCVSPVHRQLEGLIARLSSALVRGELVIAKGDVPVGSLFMRSLKKMELGPSLPGNLPGLAGFPGEPIKQYCGRYFASEKKGSPFWLSEYDYQPNRLGFMLALCLAFPADHQFYLSSLPHLFPRFDEEVLLNILIGDNFKTVKADSKKLALDALSANSFSRLKAFIPVKPWEDMVGKHLGSWDLAKFQQNWALADSVDKVNRAWAEIDPENWEKYDSEWQCAEYRGWKISALRPNGGITNVSVFNGTLWNLSTESCNFPIKDGDRFGDTDEQTGGLFSDELWHIALAKNFVDWKLATPANDQDGAEENPQHSDSSLDGDGEDF